MKLVTLLKNIEIEKIVGNIDVEVFDLALNSKHVIRGSLFFSINGYNENGKSYINEVEKYGATVIVSEEFFETNLTLVIVKNIRKTMSLICANYYNHPDKELKIIGIVGTNGKTTTANIIYKILKDNNINCGLIGTLGVEYNNNFLEPTLTTPDPIVLFKILYDMKKNNVKVVVMEVSAHAIFLDKVYKIEFEHIIFTNFTQDHLDFFKTMEKYKQAKLKIFSENKIKYIICNVDDSVGIEISRKNENVLTYGLKNPSDIFAINIKTFNNKTEFFVNLFDKILKCEINLIGEYNVYNSLAGLISCSLLGVKCEEAVKSLNSIKKVSGRLELIYNGKFNIYVDYAHTPDGLEKSLKTLKKICKGKLISVFGCGGNRDTKKRAVMGKISGKISDFTIITSDNPRFEDPMEIINEIEKGVLSTKGKYVIVEDRYLAIKYAIEHAKDRDVVLIAGKGAEKTQEVLGSKKIFNDSDTVLEIIGGNVEK